MYNIDKVEMVICKLAYHVTETAIKSQNFKPTNYMCKFLEISSTALELSGNPVFVNPRLFTVFERERFAT
jgi:hypothetical protein